MYGMEMFIGKNYFSSTENTTTNKDEYSSWKAYRMLKRMAKDKKFDSIIKTNIISNKKIKSGTPIIKGTRISTKDIMRMISDNFQIDQIMIELPSITDDKQILAAIVYEIRKMNCITFVIEALKKN